MNQEIDTTYDYIIAGSGCAGLSLLYRLLKDPILKNKNILVVDKAQKDANDRTWCFWEKGAGLFEPIVAHQWKTLEFITEDFKKQFELKQYSYKMIKGLDFYQFIANYAKKFKNVTFKLENITQIESENAVSTLITDKGSYSAKYLFNSTSLFNPEINMQNSLLQHFTGWVIETEEPNFNDKIGTLMDFSLDQKNGATFMYVLPTSAHQALVEYTLFTEKLLAKSAYKNALERYITNDLKIKNYKIIHTEFGVIPMSLAKFSRKKGNDNAIVNIGTAGGYTKASSGYTFQFIQKNTALIVGKLRNNELPQVEISFREKVFAWYDRTLVSVILNKKVEGKEIFARLFNKLPPENILTFLDNESSLTDDIKLMRTLPILPFLTAGIKQLFK